MKKLLTILILLVAVASQGWAGTEILSNFSTVNENQTTFSFNEGKGTFSQSAGAWTGGIQYYPANDIWAYRLVVTTEDNADLKIEVEYEDGMSMEFSDAQATNQRILNLEHSKKIQKIFIQDKTGGSQESPNVIVFTSINYDDEIDATAETGKTKLLDCFTPYSGVTYSNHKFSGAHDGGMQCWIGDNSNIHNSSIIVETSESKMLEIGIEYTDGWYAKYKAESKNFNLSIDPKRNIKKLEICNRSNANISELEFKEMLISNGEGSNPTIPKYSIKSGFTGTDEDRTQTYTVPNEKNLYAKDLYLKFQSSITAQILVTYTDSDIPVEYANKEAQERHLKLNFDKKLKEIKVISTSPIVWSWEDMYVGEEESNELEMPTTLTLSWTGTQALSGTPVTVAASEFSSVTAGTKVQLTVNADGTMNVAIPNTETVLINGQVRAGGSYFEVTAGNIDALKANGISITGSGTTLTAIGTSTYTTATITLSGDNPLSCGWSSSYNTSNNTVTITSAWGARGWFVGNDQYNDKKCITVNFAESGVSASGSLKMEYISANGVLTSTEASIATTDTKVSLDIPESIVRIVQVYFTSGTANATYQLSSVEVEEKTPVYTLTTPVTPTGAGTIQVQTVVGEEATDTEETSFASGTNLKLTANPAANYAFSKWTVGSTDYNTNPYQFTITEAVTATVTFVPSITKDSFSAMSGTYSENVLSGNGSLQLYIGSESTISGTRFIVNTAAPSQLSIQVYYVGDTSGPTVYETISGGDAAKASYELKLDKTKMIEKIQIYNQSSDNVTFSSISLGQDDDATGTISTDDLPYGSNSTYTQGNKTVEFTGSENARGWNVGGTTYNGKTITVTFTSEPALENGVITLVLEYYDAHGALKKASNVNTGNTIELEVPDGTQAIKRAYLTVASTGTFVLSEITATTIVKYTLTKNATNGAIRVVKSNGDVTTDTEIKAGEVLKLWAIGDDGYDFTEWTIGGSTSTANPYTLTMDAAKEVTATFATAPTDPSALWSGSKAINWNTVEIAASNFASANTGDKIIINVDYVGDDDWPQVALRKNASDPLSGAENTQLSSSMTSVTYYINESMLADLKQYGLFVSGAGYRLKSVKLEADDDPTTVWTGLVAGSTNFDTNDVLNTNNEKILAGVEAKDTIYIYTTGVATGASYELKYKVGDNWTWTELISGASVPEIIKYAATAESAPLIANRGLVISGSGYSINKISLHKFKETPLTAGDTRTLWVNADGTDVSWNEIGTQGATLGAILEVGEKILVTVKSASTTETDRQVCLRDANSEIVTGFSSFDEVTAYPYVAKFTLTSDYVDKLKNGFHISGTNTTVTKMELYKPLPDTRTEKNLYGEAAMDSTVSDGITIAAEKFVNISEDDVLMIYLSGTKATDFITLRETTNWTQLTSSYKEYMTAGQTVFTLTLNDVNVAKLKAGGLNLTGGNFTITKITIKTNGEIPADEGGEEGGDDDEEVIIDEKTGEADLTELTAQDGTKTTLTQNEDGSITMTTTEAYCAAQIWFNDPEPVAGNVLKVELAESKVNVTVTVKYTDGTESQMSANTKAVVSARATTRAVASGTTIEVPLETGKEVQNIEVKNNEAGTITIKKMQVTTINVFTGGVANLAMLKPQSNATYDTSAHTLATTKGWTGATVSPVAGENVSGKELLIEFADASKVKVSVKYRTDVEGPSKIMDKAAKSVRLAIDNTKNIQEISIQPTEAAIITFTKIAVNSEESDDGSLKPGKTITLWESATGETLSWNEVAKQDASVGEMLKEYDELLITVSGVVKDCDWPKLFIRDASSEQAGNEVLLNDVGSFPYTVRIVLTGEMAQQLQKGFSICGDGVTVKKLQVYRPEAPKTGDIHLADLNYGYNSSYDKGTHTITTTARWAARGWEIGDKRYNDKNLITVKFEAVDFPVTLKMEYTTGLQTAQATSVGVPAGRTELLLEIPKGISKLNRVYIIYENPGKVKLTEASVTYMENLKLSTAIQAFEADGVIRDGRYDTDGWYNLRGMRIPEPTTSGIYIHGGKKVVIY